MKLIVGNLCVGAVVAIGLLTACRWKFTEARGSVNGKEEIEKFNDRYQELHLKMDHPGIFALWGRMEWI